ncbi:hypothetical protein TrRE_jg5479 [Triparma retinervis]|uniref:Uncharacterized protein n=1 Tax=Triparma retinervis TaxID=2557542 RepID=A0A9W7DS92_9STRA|nr:hypothetical protein TrRE_jg5479 [Triparma retinervis]
MSLSAPLTHSPVIDVESGSPPSHPSTITDSKLLRMNKYAFILHFSQATLMLATYLAVDSVRDFTKPVRYTFAKFNATTNGFTQESAEAFDLPVGLITPFFLYMSALAHLLCMARPGEYLGMINRGINRMRWYEYALSSSLMIVMIAALFGVWDLGNLVAIVGCNASMNLFGLWMEEKNMPENRRGKEVDWTPFFLGCISGVVPWVNTMIAFLGGGDFGNIPKFVYGILIGYFVFFNTFPVNMVLQYAKVGKWRDYRYGEVTYIVLSLLSKSLLAWLVFGGTFQPNGS